MKHTLLSTLAGTALVAGSVAYAVPADAAGASYPSCTALHRDFKHGVAKGPAAARAQTRSGHYLPAYGARAVRVYWNTHKSLDRDKDGTACEVTR